MSEAPSRPDLTVITVTYQSRELVVPALMSALEAARQVGMRSEVIVVDNASTDGSADTVEAALPIKAIRNNQNVGFGRANNQAFSIALGERWLLLNPDADIDGEALEALVNALDRDLQIGAVAPTLEGPGLGAESAGMHPSVGSALGHFWFFNRIPLVGQRGSLAGVQLRGQGGGRRIVDWASAAVLLLRPEAVRTAGGFDESIFMYGEDVEFGRRIRASGWHVLLEPQARARHQVASGRGVSTAWFDGLHHLVRRERGRAHAAGFAFVAATGLAVRAVSAHAWRSRLSPLQRQRLAASARRAAVLFLDDVLGRRARGPSAS